MNTVIVVDDDQTFTGLLRTIFEMEGYQVVVISQPDQVVPTARLVRPILILMDVHTGRGSTLDVLRELRADETLQNVAVLMNSGMDRSTEYLAAGADAFILKPFRPSDLLTKVEKVIEKKRLEKKHCL